MNPRILLVGQPARSSCLGLRGERSSFFDVGPRVDWPCSWRREGTLIVIMRSYVWEGTRSRTIYLVSPTNFAGIKIALLEVSIANKGPKQCLLG